MITHLFFAALLFGLTQSYQKTTSFERRVYIPPHQYSFGFIQSFNYTFALSWKSQSALSVQIKRLSDNRYYQNFDIRKESFQSFSYICRETGIYSIKITPSQIEKKFFCYTVNVVGESIQDNSVQNCFFQQHTDHSAFAVELQGSSRAVLKYYSAEAVTVEYYCSIKQDEVIGPYFPVLKQPFQIEKQCQTELIVLIKQNLQLNLRYFTISMQIKYGQCSTDTCLMTQSISVPGLLIGMFAFVFGILIGVGVYKIRQLLRLRQRVRNIPTVTQIQIRPNSVNLYNIEQTLQDIQQVEPSTCAICLDGSCNVRLICKHQYHKKCISKWIEKNSQCPICRSQLIQQKNK